MGFNAGEISASLTVDRDPFEVGLDQAKADAEEFAGHSYSVTLDVNDNGLAKLDESSARINEFDFTHATAVLDFTFADDAIAKYDTAEAMVKGFGAEHDTATVDVNVNGADAALRDLEAEVANTERTLGGLGNSTSSLGTKFRDTKNDTDILKNGLADVTTGTEHFLSGMSAVDDANRALESGFRDANQGLLDVGIGMRALEGGGAAVTQIMGGVATAASSGGGGVDKFGAAVAGLGDSIPWGYVAIGALATALIPIAGVATGAGIALAGMATAGVAGIGAFVLAAGNQLSGFTSGLKSEVADWQSQFSGLTKPIVADITGRIGTGAELAAAHRCKRGC